MTCPTDLAFPFDPPNEVDTEFGLSKREYIATHVAGAFINSGTSKHAFPTIALAAVALADALIAALNK